MNKSQQIAELKKALANAHENIDALNIEARDAAERRKISDILAEGQAAQRVRDEKRATEAATLKSIRDGYVPIETLRGLTSQDYSTQHNKTRTLTSLTLNLDGKNPVAKSLLDALLAPQPQDGVLKVKYTLAEPSADFGSSYGAASTLSPKAPPMDDISDAYAKLLGGQKVNVEQFRAGVTALSGPFSYGGIV